MEGTESTSREGPTAKDGNQEVLMSNKPLHRFVKKEPRVLGIVIVIFGCAELLMGFHLAGETIDNSTVIYIPFWQGLLFLICGNLSIYTEVHPSKKMVTVCLAMYIVSIFGIIVSFGYRIHCLARYGHLSYIERYSLEEGDVSRVKQILGVEGILFTSSLCVSVLLIFLCTIARLALKSTRTQVIVLRVPPPPTSDTTSN